MVYLCIKRKIVLAFAAALLSLAASAHKVTINIHNVDNEKGQIGIVADKAPIYPGAFALGIRGQVLYINPDKHLIMVRLGANNYEYYDASFIFDRIAQVL